MTNKILLKLSKIILIDRKNNKKYITKMRGMQ